MDLLSGLKSIGDEITRSLDSTQTQDTKESPTNDDVNVSSLIHNPLNKKSPGIIPGAFFLMFSVS